MNQEYYNEHKDELKALLLKNSEFKIDDQRDGELEQVAIWCTSFSKNWSICFQNGDMNGNYKGTAIFDNAGADCGLIELRNIIELHGEFR